MKKTKNYSSFGSVGILSFYANVLTADAPSIVKMVADAIKWKSESIDVGNIPQGKPKLIRFEFTNTSSKPIIIQNVAPSCGCTTADYTKHLSSQGKKDL